MKLSSIANIATLGATFLVSILIGAGIRYLTQPVRAATQQPMAVTDISVSAKTSSPPNLPDVGGDLISAPVPSISERNEQLQKLVKPLQTAAAMKLLFEWAREDPTGAISAWEQCDLPWAVGHQSPREEALSALLNGWAETAPSAAAEWLTAHADLAPPLSTTFVTEVGRLDPELAVNVAEQCGLREPGNPILPVAIELLHSQSPEAAVDRLSEAIPKSKDPLLLGNSLDAIRDSSGDDGMLRFASNLIEKVGGAPGIVRSVASRVAEIDAMAALDLALSSVGSVNGEALLDQVRADNSRVFEGYMPPLSGTVATVWEQAVRSNSESALTYLGSVEDQELRTYLEGRIPLALAESDPDLAIDVLSKLSDDGMITGARNLAYSIFQNQDPPGALKFAERLPNPTTKQAYLEALQHLKGRNGGISE